MGDITLESNGYYKVDPLYQWDLNQTLYIYGVSVVRPVIHFNNKSMVNSIVRQPSIDKAGVISVNIPNSLLQKTEPICVYVCAYEGDAFKTYYKMEIQVKARPKPADYTLDVDDGEVYSFVKLEQMIVDTFADYELMYTDMGNRVVKCEQTVAQCKTIENNCLTETDAVKNALTILSGNVDALKSMLSGVEVWTNPTPTATFGAQKIELDLTDYERIVIVFRHGSSEALTSANTEITCGIKNITYHHSCVGSSKNGYDVFWRTFTCNNDGVNFDDAYGLLTDPTITNNSLIPYKIIGYKY